MKDGMDFNKKYLAGRKAKHGGCGDFLTSLDRITCEDGFNVSVQASAYHYCTPRDSRGPWFEVECGFPSQPVPEWREWRDGEAEDTGNVFGYVPIDKVLAVLDQHGGIKKEDEK